MGQICKMKKHRKMWSLIKVLLVYLLLFTIAMVCVTLKLGYEMTTLISMTFSVIGVELVVMMIKRLLDDRGKK